MRNRSAWLGAAMATAVVIGGCEPIARLEVDAARQQAGRPPLVVSEYLEEAARANSAEMCAVGSATPSPAPLSDYDGETAVALDELVGVATLDPSIVNPVDRDIDATQDIWQAWNGDPSIVSDQWDEFGIGEATCSDGALYSTLLLREEPTMPATGRYSSAIYNADQITRHEGLVYGTAVNHLGQTQTLLLDLWTPPPGGESERPLVLYVHGGGFAFGSRTAFAANAVQYARRGFVVASIDYRLQPNETPEEQLAAALNAIDDGMESVRWLRANAGPYGIDPDRILALGSSAGGAIVLGIGHATDPTPGGPLAAIPATVTAVVSTGAHLTPGLDLIDFAPTGAETMMMHYEKDTAAGKDPWYYAYETCTAIRSANGPVCDFVKQLGSGHTVSLGPTGPWWTPEIGPFAWEHLGLGA